MHPARLQRWFLEIPEEERLEIYAERWRRFQAALGPRREVLGLRQTHLTPSSVSATLRNSMRSMSGRTMKSS
jgi:hypothetical protein